MKICSVCSVIKPYSDFRVEKRTKEGFHSWCRSCESSYQKINKALPESKDKRRKAAIKKKLSYKDLYTSSPSLIDKDKFCPGCNETKTRDHFNLAVGRKGGLRDYCKICDRNAYRIRYNDTKQAIYEKLGDICYRCGFKDKRALQIDHINGGGNQEHKEIKNSIAFLKKVSEDDTGSYQILCANCSWIKRSENKEEPFYELRLSSPESELICH